MECAQGRIVGHMQGMVSLSAKSTTWPSGGIAHVYGCRQRMTKNHIYLNYRP
jgi:hypothetical protein